MIKSSGFWIRLIITYSALCGGGWGILEAYTYFSPDSLKRIVGSFWVLIYIIPLPIAVFVAFIGSSKSDIRSGKFRKWFDRLLNTIVLVLKWLAAKWHLVVLHSLVVLGAVVLRIYSDWKIVAFSFICYVVGLLSWKFSNKRPKLFSKSKSNEIKTKFLPIALLPGVGNAYLKKRYSNPPAGDVLLGNVHFQLGPDSLIFDTNEQIRYYRQRNDGGSEIDIQLPTPQCHVRSAYFLINSGNSKSIYAHQSIGEIRLVFKDAPPIVVELVLGENIREWCPGNPGDFVRDASSPMITMDAWTGLSKHGGNAVIDCLQIPVYACMRNCFLEKIILVHKSLQKPPDTMGVHFSIFAMSLEVAQGI